MNQPIYAQSWVNQKIHLQKWMVFLLKILGCQNYFIALTENHIDYVVTARLT